MERPRNDEDVISMSFMESHIQPEIVPDLHWSSYHGDIRRVRKCISKGQNINETINLCNRQRVLLQGVTPLYLAAQAGHLDIVRELVRAGADVAASVTNANTRCTAQAIALMNMNLQVWWYLKGKSSKKARSSGDVGGSSAAAAAVGGGDATASAQPKSFIPSRSPTANDIVNQIDNHDKAERALSWSEKRRVLDYAALRQDRQYMQLA